ncbi:MAG: hypothetical protein ACYC9Q_14245 [Bacillota bacterium]
MGKPTILKPLGNHNFDYGPGITQARRAESQFPWLSANTVVVDPAARPIQPFDGTKVYITNLGQKIAFIGLTETPPAGGRRVSRRSGLRPATGRGRSREST